MKNNLSYTSALASVYDRLNADVCAESWADFAIRASGVKKGAKICEMACGTGSVAIELAKRNYSVMAFDLSPDMLSEADRKASDAGVKITFTCQDMRSFSCYGEADAVVAFLDSINYLTDAKGVKSAFSRANKALLHGGAFIFDINSKYKFENIYKDNAYILEQEGVVCAWQNFYNPKSRICDFYLSLFTENADGTYCRFDEHQREKMYTVKQIKKYLKEEGFEITGIYSSFNMEEADESKDERLFFVCRKI